MFGVDNETVLPGPQCARSTNVMAACAEQRNAPSAASVQTIQASKPLSGLELSALECRVHQGSGFRG